jgi:hypothetical protein
MAVTLCLKELHEKFSYPREILNFNDRNLDLSLFNGSVYDFKNGTIIRLGEDAQVSHAIRGLDSLSVQEI